MSDCGEQDQKGDAVDPFLKMVAGVAESFGSTAWEGAGVPVTVLVQGSIVTGLAIAEREYVKALGERWRHMFASSGPLSQLADRLDGSFQEHANNLANAESVEDDFDFLHLREAYIVHGTGMLPTQTLEGQPLLLRIPLARVDAFTLGRLQAAPALPGDEQAPSP